MTRALGIDIGSHSIKIAEIEYTKKLRQIVGLYSCPLEPGRTPGELLREFLEKGQIRADRVAVGLHRLHQLPGLADRALRRDEWKVGPHHLPGRA